MKIREVLSNATSTLFSKFGKSILAILAYLLITFALGLLSIIPIIGAIAMYILLVPILFGFTKQFIKIYNGEGVKSFDFLHLGFEKFGMAWRVTGRLALKYIGSIIVMAIAYGLMGVGLVAGGAGLIGMSSEAATAGGIATVVGTVLLVISAVWYLVLSLKYAFAYNELAYNDSATTGKEVIENVAKNMEGNKGKLVGLYLVLFALALVLSMLMAIPVLGLIIAIAVLLLLAPFMQFVMVAFYDDVRNEKMPKAQAVETIEYNTNNNPQDPIQM